MKEILIKQEDVEYNSTATGITLVEGWRYMAGHP
jgi:hypothetical protein